MSQLCRRAGRGGLIVDVVRALAEAPFAVAEGCCALNPFPTPFSYTRIGSAALYRSPLGAPGTDLRVCGDWYGHEEDICGRSFNELTVIHTR